MPLTREPDPGNTGGGIVENGQSPLRSEGYFLERGAVRQRGD